MGLLALVRLLLPAAVTGLVPAPAAQAPPVDAYGHGYVGVSVQETPVGIAISDVREGLPAQKAGLLAGDVITRANGYPADNSALLIGVISAVRPGRHATLKILRNGKPMTVRVKVGRRPPPSPEMPLPPPAPIYPPPPEEPGDDPPAAG